MPNDDAAWWREGVLYQIYVRSFADSDGDGTGDLQGVIDHLDHLEWLGVDGIWLSPITPSPDRDWGYDVSDYRDVHPELGDLATLDRLVSDAASRDIRVILDLVPNHTSDRHPWFVDARSSREAAHRDWYVWADPRADGSPPNNWRSVFGGSAWELDPDTGQYYLHNFLPEQPDLNWWNEEVRDEFDGILRFWFDRGIAGFRIDVANGLIHDPELRDNPPATDDDPAEIRRRGQRQVHNLNRPEVHDIYRGWRTIADGYDPQRILVAETWVFEPRQLARFYGKGDDELHLCFNFSLVFSEFRAEALRGVVGSTEAALPPGSQPAWTGSNHDVGRFPTRWCDGWDERSRCALMALLALRGTPFLYYGDEIGMIDVPIAGATLSSTWSAEGEQNSRAAMPAGPRCGGTRGRGPGSRPRTFARGSRSATRARSTSRISAGTGVRCSTCAATSSPCGARRRICVRAPTPRLPSPAGRRGPGAADQNVDRRRQPVRPAPRLCWSGRGRIAIGTDRARDGERVEWDLSLGPWEGAVLRVAPA